MSPTTPHTSDRTALILGATGSIGGHMVQALARRGWTVRAMTRNPELARKQHAHLGCDWIAGDAMNAADVAKAAEGVSLIFHGVNPPGYKQWDKLVLPMLDNTIAAATVQNARVFLPGTIYNYGPDAFPLLSPDSPQTPHTRKGEIRAEMERRLMAAADAGDIRVTILRCGDWFGPGATANSWFKSAIVQPGKQVKRVTNPGTRGVGHAWAYLPDVAETFARLADMDQELSAFENFHFDGFWDADGETLARKTASLGGVANAKVTSFPWPLMYLIAPFNETLREVIKMRSYWRHPARLDNASLVAVLGEEPRTPIDEAILESLAEAGCLEPARRAEPATRQLVAG